MVIQSEIVNSINKKYIGERLEVLIDPAAASGGKIVGRSRFQAPEVDGVIIITRLSSRHRPLAAIEEVEIVAADIYDLRGVIV